MKALSKLNLPKNVDIEEVEKIKTETFAPLSREDGIDPRDIIHEVQEAIAPVDYIFVRSEDRMKEALAIVEDRIPDP